MKFKKQEIAIGQTILLEDGNLAYVEDCDGSFCYLKNDDDEPIHENTIVNVITSAMNYYLHFNGVRWKGYNAEPTAQQKDVEVRSFKDSEYYDGGEIKVSVIKFQCDVCKVKVGATYSNNTKQYMCEECWMDYGEMCHYGLA